MMEFTLPAESVLDSGDLILSNNIEPSEPDWMKTPPEAEQSVFGNSTNSELDETKEDDERSDSNRVWNAEIFLDQGVDGDDLWRYGEDPEYYKIDDERDDDDNSFCDLDFGFNVANSSGGFDSADDEWEEDESEEAKANREVQEEENWRIAGEIYAEWMQDTVDPVDEMTLRGEEEHGRGLMTAVELLPDEELHQSRKRIIIYAVVEHSLESQDCFSNPFSSSTDRSAFLTIEEAEDYCLNEARFIYYTHVNPIFCRGDGNSWLEIERHKVVLDESDTHPNFRLTHNMPFPKK